jgi:hypothetical protein
MWNSFTILAVSCIVAACSACPHATSTHSGEPPLDVPADGTTLLVNQRSTTVIPGSKGSLLLTVGDVTRGQVPTSISIVADSRSMRNGDLASFWVDGHAFTLTLEHLENSLLGMDTATFRITSGTRKVALTEQEKIGRIIDHLRNLEGVTFIRNGFEYDETAAAELLELQWYYLTRGATITITAKQFIESIGNIFSEPEAAYQIRLADGTEMPAVEFFDRQLEKIEDPE